jgi:hypothetical protein
MLCNVFNNVEIKLELESGFKEKFYMLPAMKAPQKNLIV